MRVSSPALRKKMGGQSALLAPVFQVPLARNNRYAEVAYFGMLYSKPLPYLLFTAVLPRTNCMWHVIGVQ